MSRSTLNGRAGQVRRYSGSGGERRGLCNGACVESPSPGPVRPRPVAIAAPVEPIQSILGETRSRVFLFLSWSAASVSLKVAHLF
jgi:hypothetical protein